jgi:hypothetical protein
MIQCSPGLAHITYTIAKRMGSSNKMFDTGLSEDVQLMKQNHYAYVAIEKLWSAFVNCHSFVYVIICFF